MPLVGKLIGGRSPAQPIRQGRIELFRLPLARLHRLIEEPCHIRLQRIPVIHCCLVAKSAHSGAAQVFQLAIQYHGRLQLEDITERLIASGLQCFDDIMLPQSLPQRLVQGILRGKRFNNAGRLAQQDRGAIGSLLAQHQFAGQFDKGVLLMLDRDIQEICTYAVLPIVAQATVALRTIDNLDNHGALRGIQLSTCQRNHQRPSNHLPKPHTARVSSTAVLAPVLDQCLLKGDRERRKPCVERAFDPCVVWMAPRRCLELMWRPGAQEVAQVVLGTEVEPGSGHQVLDKNVNQRQMSVVLLLGYE
ncbi:hypothetical protein D3C80_1085130 [compost metagenome]